MFFCCLPRYSAQDIEPNGYGIFARPFSLVRGSVTSATLTSHELLNARGSVTSATLASCEPRMTSATLTS